MKVKVLATVIDFPQVGRVTRDTILELPSEVVENLRPGLVEIVAEAEDETIPWKEDQD
jgi:hypothetical protein